MTPVSRAVTVRAAAAADLEAVRAIYNAGIADRVATLDEEPKREADIAAWWSDHGGRYAVVVAERDGAMVGWCSLNRYSHRCAYDGVADLSVYVAREARGTGVGTELLRAAERLARENGFHKIVLFTLPFNAQGQALYRKSGFREVGTFRNQGRLDGRFVDVMAMEKLLTATISACTSSDDQAGK
jgi:phosphinothricin acetyltransferase